MSRFADLRLSVIIPVLNDAERLARCLASLRTNAVPSDETEVIVVDNGSTDASREVAQAAGAEVLVVPGVHVGGLRNLGAARARGRFLAFIDADHEVVSGWVEAACSLLDDGSVAAAGAACLPPEPGTWVQATYGRLRGRPSGRRDVEWLGSGNMAVTRRAFREIGGFDTRLQACEDVDLCQRFRAAGWRLVSDERLGSIHHGDPRTLGALFRSELWRGRDNLRVSLRHVTLRGLPSMVIPVAELAALGLIPLGLASWRLGGFWAAGVGASSVLALAVLRAARIMGSPGAKGPRSAFEAFAVALTYDLGRALALVYTARHRHAR